MNPRNTVYIGIDQSYTGFALAVYQHPNNNHDIILKDYSKAKAGVGVDRLLKIEADLRSIFKIIDGSSDIAHITIEGYSHGAKAGRELAGELGYAVKRVIRDRMPSPQAYPTIVPPTSVKKFCVGKGSAPKSLMIKTVLTKWDVDVDDDNMADAYTLARIAACYRHPERAQHKYETEVLENLAWHTELGLTEKAA